MPNTDLIKQCSEYKDVIDLPRGIVVTVRPSIPRRIRHHGWGVIDPRSTEIGEYQTAIFLNQEIMTPEVTMDDLLGMYETERFSGLYWPCSAS